nr:inositol monophosphatase [uncultured Devosia sp.]
MTDKERERADRLAAGKTIIREAGALALDYFSRYDTLDVQAKRTPQDLFSEADTKVEALIRDAISSQFPGDALVGEEHGASGGDSVYQWVIDPIDGTSCFLYGLPTWCVVICLLENGVPVVSLTYDACRDQLFWASKGQGAWRNDARISVNTRATIADGLTAIGGSNAIYSQQMGQIIERVLAAGGSYMRNGSTALTLAHVAAGHYVGYFQPLLNSWDCLAGLLLVAEAGGVSNDFMAETGLHGRGDVFAAAPQVAGQMAEIVGR